MASQPTLLSKPVGPIGYGLMGLTWRESPPPSSQAFEAMSTALSKGANFWNGGEFYGPVERNSTHVLHEYFTQHPDDASKVVLSIKGGLKKGALEPDGSEENVRRSVDDCLAVLDGKKSIDIFECARVDHNVPIEDTIRALAKCVREGKIGGIGVSEVKAETIRRAAAVHPIAAVEVELSLWATDILRNGVAAACAELNIPIVAYSPLSRGALTSEGIKRNADIPDNDFRKHIPKFQDDVLEQNNKLTEEVGKLAQQKGVSRAQVAIAWVRQLSGRTVPSSDGKGNLKLGTIIPIPGATTQARVEENCKIVELTEEEMKEIADVIKRNPIKGDRYPAMAMKHVEG